MIKIDDELKFRIPMLTERNLPLLERLIEHKHSPIYNFSCGDRLTFTDKKFLDVYEEDLQQRSLGEKIPGEKWIETIHKQSESSPFLKKQTHLLDLNSDFERIPLMHRGDLSKHLVDIVPDGSDFSRLIVNPTSGTTGHSIPCPNHPLAIGCYNPLLFYSLKSNGISIQLNETTIASMLICSQENTIVYSTVKPILNGAGYSKINLNPKTWNDPGDTVKFIEDLQPEFLCGDPVSFYDLLSYPLKYQPKALLSTSLKMTDGIRKRLIETFGCPVVDFYSLNETGPIAYSCRKDPNTFHVLPKDLFVEITDSEGNRLPEGEIGFIVVTGGRNPYLPLLRYNTGDRGSLDFSPCDCGEKTPKLRMEEARKPVYFINNSGKRINPIDISRWIRKFRVHRHKLFQKKNGDLELILDIEKGFFDGRDETNLSEGLKEMFSKDQSIQIEIKEGNSIDWEGFQIYESELNPLENL
ncbi:MAG: phenylacetate--CoA ligase family protein [Leptospiraceae bacterium]|nr:phenylacetate--CoA ligase family protein [Leptospiraceae bacterium]MCP5511898.1 phenylacetate--CoA ligase family protein [Leptospiraceae bacterium]